MTVTTESRRFTRDTQQYVAANFTNVQQGSGVLAIALMIISGLMIVATVDNISPAQAVYQAGLTGEAIGFVLALGWGASRNHGAVCTSHANIAEEATQELEQRIAKAEATLNERLDEIVTEFTKQLGGISSELRRAIEVECDAVEAAREAARAACEAARSRHDELMARRSRN